MTNLDNHLDQLFERARKEPPMATFEETVGRFSETIAAGSAGASAALFSKLNIFTIGLSLFATLTVIAVLVFNKAEPTTKNRTALPAYEPEKEISQSITTPQNEVKVVPNVLFSKPKPPVAKAVADQADTSSNNQTQVRQVVPIVVPLPVKKQDPLRTLSSNTKEPEIIVPKGRAVQFTINELTSTNLLASISQQAQRAGIDYTYVVDLKKKLIREFNVEMSIIGTNNASSIRVSVLPKGKFEISFGWFVNAEGKAIRLTDDIRVVEAKPKHPLRITLARDIYRIYLENGINYIEDHFDALTENANPKDPKENILNSTGYLFVKENAFTKAIEIFTLNTKLFPKKANVWDSLGEAYYKNGDQQKALKTFQKALSIDPKFPSSKAWIKKIQAEQ